jgi:positive regulator of sigma E activity
MKLLLVVLALAAGLLLVAAAFVYLLDARRGQRLLQYLRVPLIVLLVVFVVSAVISAADTRAVIVGLLVMSIAAYLVRESNKPRRERRRARTGAERKPVLPPEGGEE